VSWFDTKLGRSASVSFGLLLLIVDWPNSTINPFAGPLILGAIPRSPLVRGHVEWTTLTLMGLYGVGMGFWRGEPVYIVGGAALAVLSGAGEIAYCLSTRRTHRLPEHVITAIASQPAQLIPRYNFRLANGEVAYWRVIGGAYLPLRHGRQRLDFRPDDVFGVESIPRERVW
jgi:hypothetical protein